MDTSTIELGKEMSLTRRIIAYAAVLTVYFYYCYNFSIPVFRAILGASGGYIDYGYVL